MFFRRPDLFAGTIAMSGVYDLTTYTKGYYDEDVYFNSPCHYLPNLSDENTLDRLRASGHIHILAGSGDYEDPDASRRLAGILAAKGIGFDSRHLGTRHPARLAHLAYDASVCD
jgi:esterase/lipase superfamily enzyme